MKKAVQTIFKSFLVILFLYYHIGNTAFIHTHIFHNQIITHSHPFLPGAHHSHNGVEIETISWLNAAVEFFTPLALFACLWVFLGFIFHYTLTSFLRVNEIGCSLRAPPYSL